MGDSGPSGALWPGDENSPATNGPLIYLGCEDIDGILSRVPEAGGKVVQDRLSIGEYGSIALFIDSEGNRLGLHSES
jgi:predicted enzyme related to lactoylglutathione lyase